MRAFAPGSWETSRSPWQRGAPVKAWVEGTQGSPCAEGGDTHRVRLESGEKPRGGGREDFGLQDQPRGGRDPVTGNPLLARKDFERERTPEERRVSARVDGRRETRRTLRPVAGCNKPAKPGVEQAAEAGRNSRGGTRSGVATPNLGKPRVDTQGDIGGRAVFEEPQERNLIRTRLRSRMGRVASSPVCLRRGGDGSSVSEAAEATSCSTPAEDHPRHGRGQRPTAKSRRAPCFVQTRRHRTRRQPPEGHIRTRTAAAKDSEALVSGG
jgi:hypothetical protein